MDAPFEDCLMTDKQKQIEKIRKLLALAAQSSSDGESSNAFSRVRRYMAAYGLTMEDIYPKSGPSSSNSAEAERYRREAENARQQAEAEQKGRDQERRVREEAEKKNTQYEAQERQRRDEEYFRRQAEQKSQEQQRQAKEANRSCEAEEEEQPISQTLQPAKKSFTQRIFEGNTAWGVSAFAALVFFLAMNSDGHKEQQPEESHSIATPQIAAAPAVATSAEPERLTINGYTLKSQSARYCVDNDIEDFSQLNPLKVQFANNHSVGLNDGEPLQINERLGDKGYSLENGDIITLSKDAVITGLNSGGRELSCYATAKKARSVSNEHYRTYQARAEQLSAPKTPPAPDPVNIFEYSANSRNVRTCLADGTQEYKSDGSVSYKLQTFFFVSPSEVGFGKNTSGITVVKQEGNGMYKLSNDDEVGVDVFGTIQRYWTKKLSFTCFADEQEVDRYLSAHAPQ